MNKKENQTIDIPEMNQKENIFGKTANFFIERYKLVYLLIISLVIMGVGTYMAMPKETMPDVSLNTIVVTTIYPGGSVSDIEKLITEPLEDCFAGADDIKEITSSTQNGGSNIIISFEDNADMKQAETNINNEISSFKLPEGAYEPMVQNIETGEIPLMQLTITGDYDLVQLKSFGDDIQDEIEKIEGVRNVDVIGGTEREIKINLDFTKMLAYNISTNTIQNALQSSNINIPAGQQNIDNQTINIRIDEGFKSVDEIENLVLVNNQNRSVFLKDIGQVVDGYKEPSDYAYKYSKETSLEKKVTPTINIIVYRETGYDVIEPSRTIRKLLEEEKGGLFPEAVIVEITADQSEDVGETLSDVLNNAVGGLLVVIIVLFIFIGLNEALIVSSVIPLTLLATLIIMNRVGITLNAISLTGFIIALGLLVDNAIVVMENVDRLRDNNLDRKTASKLGINQVGPAIFAATLTTMLAFIPVAMTPGTIGKFLSTMPKTVIIIIGVSLVMSIIVTPTLCSRYLTSLKKKKVIEEHQKEKNRIGKILPIIFIFILALIAFMNQGKVEIVSLVAAFSFVGLYLLKEKITHKARKEKQEGYVERYGRKLYELLDNKKKKITIILSIVIIFIGSIATLPMGILKLELFPTETPKTFEVEIEAPKGTLIKDTTQIALSVEERLYNYEEIETFTITVGNGGNHLAKVTAELTDEETRKKSGIEIVEEVKADLKDIPGGSIKVIPITGMEKMTQGAPVSIGLKGDNMEELIFYGNQYLDILKNIEGVENPEHSAESGMKEIVVDIDKNKALRYGLSVSQISGEIRQQISGMKVGIYKENSEEYDIVLYYAEDKITQLKDFDKIFFKNNKGQLVNFNEVATLKHETAMTSLKREDGKKIVKISAEVQSGYNANDIMQVFMAETENIKLPDSIERVKAGQAEDLESQISNMLKNFIIALLLVYLVLVFQFNSFSQPVVILLSIPFAIIGVIWGLIVTGNSLGFYAMFGIVALVGIAVNEAIVLIDFTNYNKRNGQETKEAIVEAVKIRMVPIFATTLTTMGGVLPLALFNEQFSQLGYALIFGLMVSVILTLVVIPITYYGIEKLGEKLSGKLGQLKRI